MRLVSYICILTLLGSCSKSIAYKKDSIDYNEVLIAIHDRIISDDKKLIVNDVIFLDLHNCEMLQWFDTTTIYSMLTM